MLALGHGLMRSGTYISAMVCDDVWKGKIGIRMVVVEQSKLNYVHHYDLAVEF
jgi:hypothetical protein